jgi:hypothetical protein
MSGLNISLVPNPMTPLAFLPPDPAYRIEIARYVLVGTLGVSSALILCRFPNAFRDPRPWSGTFCPMYSTTTEWCFNIEWDSRQQFISAQGERPLRFNFSADQG